VPERSHRLRVLLAFACIWFVWGSTFLVIRYAIADIPPLLMCGVRLTLAGALMLAFAAVTGAPRPTATEWRNALLIGFLLPGIGNASVTLAVAHVPSGVVALLVATIPLWMALLSSFGPHASPPGRQALAGLVLGFAGIALLLLGPGSTRHAAIDPLWALLPVAGSLSWAWGSLWSRQVALPRSPMLSTGSGLAAAGLVIVALAAAQGDLGQWHPAAVHVRAWLSLAYLAVFGSVIGFGAYLFLLRHVAPPVVATYAFVNPVVAMALGWFAGGEKLGPRTLLAAAIVLVAVVIITTARPGRRGADAPVGATALARRP